jgi:hypothetical protein
VFGVGGGVLVPRGGGAVSKIRDGSRFMNKKPYTFHLTEEQAKLLSDVLTMHMDKGPEGEGWQSEKLGELCYEIVHAINPSLLK